MSQVKRIQSEFLGLHDPYSPATTGNDAPRPPAGPLVTREKAAELLRAGATLTVILLLMAVVVSAIH
jgi:hypothetical protein